jgi:hypothetical protein
MASATPHLRQLSRDVNIEWFKGEPSSYDYKDIVKYYPEARDQLLQATRDWYKALEKPGQYEWYRAHEFFEAADSKADYELLGPIPYSPPANKRGGWWP